MTKEIDKTEQEPEEILVQLMNKLRINREKVSAEDRKGKYKKAFDQLERDVMSVLAQVLDRQVFLLLVPPDHHVELQKYAVELITAPEFASAVRQCKADKVMAMLPEYKMRMMEKIKSNGMAGIDSPIRYSLNPLRLFRLNIMEDSLCS